MAKKQKAKKKRAKDDPLVYSTDPNATLQSVLGNYFNRESELQDPPLPAHKQKLYVARDRKKRGGKEVTLITGYVGAEADLKELGRWIKKQCGVGGSVKDGEIIIQGDQRDKVVTLLTSRGFQVVRKGG